MDHCQHGKCYWCGEYHYKGEEYEINGEPCLGKCRICGEEGYHVNEGTDSDESYVPSESGDESDEEEEGEDES